MVDLVAPACWSIIILLLIAGFVNVVAIPSPRRLSVVVVSPEATFTIVELAVVEVGLVVTACSAAAATAGFVVVVVVGPETGPTGMAAR